jgi:hypothetical protein
MIKDIERLIINNLLVDLKELESSIYILIENELFIVVNSILKPSKNLGLYFNSLGTNGNFCIQGETFYKLKDSKGSTYGRVYTEMLNVF